MRILAIETSCDETAVAVVEAHREDTGTRFTVLGNALLSQIDIHKEYGGVFPMIAKREHAKNILLLTYRALNDANLISEDAQALSPHLYLAVAELLVREEGLATQLMHLAETIDPPAIDAIAVTAGPGLEPALWVGVNFAKALSILWNIPIVSINHMEGHICTALAEHAGLEQQINGTTSEVFKVQDPELPLLSLLISGGHTELVSTNEWLSYELVGQTRDDAVGEAFDKVARMLGLSYPGGPEVSKLAEQARERGGESPITLPRPMISDASCDFSFSGLKTAVLYLVKDKELSEEEKEDMARAFEDAAADVLYAKTLRAIQKTGARMLALGGGVSANTHIKRVFRERLAEDHPEVELRIPAPALTTDNALMIAMAGFFRAERKEFTEIEALAANGNRKLAA